MLRCTETVSFVRLVKGTDGDRYISTRCDGVSWYDKTRIRTENGGVVYDNAVQIRIPAASVPAGWLPQVGDCAVRGGIRGTISTCADMEAYAPRRVVAVGDNRRGGLPHVAVTAR
ncbi:MAG: hypothetical protein IKD79_01755 [Oscillospiraceae bacterium]|nr:hypothetical protein [Oscillospiraceae bacterium]